MLILIYILDSLRRDFLGCYGAKGAMSPSLDGFAEQATRFTHAYAAAAWSKASGAALLTGQLPRAVQMRGLLDSLPALVPTLTEQLQGAGFHTVAVSANPFIAHDFELLRGFDETIEAFRPGELPGEHFLFHANHFRRLAESLSVEPEALVLARSQALHQALLEVIPNQGATFALCWSMDTHAPFFVRDEKSYFGNPLDRVIPAADAEWLTDGISVQDMVSLYRDMIAYNDAQFGVLMRNLQKRGQWDDALIIVAGDHGEGFGEHGLLGHSNGLWEEQIAIPLLVKYPHQSTSQRCDTPVSLMDIPATISKLLDLPSLSNSDLSGLPLPTQSPSLLLQPTFSQPASPHTGRALLLENPIGWALRTDEYKLIAHNDDKLPLLFNLHHDPHEYHALPNEILRNQLLRRARTLQDTAEQHALQWEDTADEIDELVLERLRGLGYL